MRMGEEQRVDNTANRDWLTRDEAEAFIGKNSSFYLEKWKAHSNSTLKGWNWAAMSFGIEWMVYRKMYAEAILFFVVVSSISFGVAAIFIFGIGIPITSRRVIGNVFRITIGVLGNYLYRKKAIRVLKMVVQENDSERIHFLNQKGGVSIISVVFCIIIEVAYAIVFML